MFFIEQKGIQIQDIIHCYDQFCALLGLEAPYYITLCKQNTNTVNIKDNHTYYNLLSIFLQIQIDVCIIENAS